MKPAEVECEAFDDRLARHEQKSLLRFLTCGSVDDGKSTLIGRLLYDAKLLFTDQLADLDRASRKHGASGKDIDFALLVDGLEAEREQGITIDVAYRFFTTERRKFIVADTPGHEQYTRNMATGASHADLAVVLVDATRGVLTQTRRHSFIASLVGIRHVVLAVNKIDLVGYSQDVFDRIVAEYRTFAENLGFQTLVPVPLSARFGDNVTTRSVNLEWYHGPTLLDHLEKIDVGRDVMQQPFRMPVQWVNRPNMYFRGYSGTIAAGRVAVGDEIVVASSGRASRVKSIVTYDGQRKTGIAGQALTLTFEDEIDISRGDIIVAAQKRPDVSDQFAARVIWMGDNPMTPGRSYILKIGARSLNASITAIRYRIDVDSFKEVEAKALELNEVAVVNIATQDAIPFEPYAQNHTLGAFILIDRLTNLTVGMGMIDSGMRRATNVHWQALDISKEVRARMKAQKPALLWFTGLPAAGKSTIANLLERRLVSLGKHTYLLDGDNVRHGLTRDLGFTEADRVENLRRVAETAKLMVDAGLIVIASFISPFRTERQMARQLMAPGEYVEVFVDTTLAIAEKRDPKGLYRRARAGEIMNFTGIDSPYEPPKSPEIHLDTGDSTPEAMVQVIMDYLEENGYLE